MEINFGNKNKVINSLNGDVAQTISATMFGGILLNTKDSIDDDTYFGHFTETYQDLSLNLIRFPDGEFPDGFLYEKEPGEWVFKHNNLNNGSGTTFFDPNTGDSLPISTEITQAYLDSLKPAFSLQYEELIAPELLESEGRASFSESLQLAVSNGSAFSMVLPEFQYLKVPVTRFTDANGVKDTFVASDHVQMGELKADVTDFLNKLFIDKGFNNGVLPEDFILELGNEDYFGWNKSFFSPDSDTDLDSYSAFALGVLEAVSEFRLENPSIDFSVSLQASGPAFVQEISNNFSDMNASDLFAEVDIIDLPHEGLASTVDEIHDIEDDWAIRNGVSELLDLIAHAGGDTDDVRLYMSAWSAKSSDVSGFDKINYGLPAAGAALSLFSGLFEMGVDLAANWGIGAWGGFGTSASGDGLDGAIYSPYGEIHRQMAESLVGTHQFATSTMDGIRGETSVMTYAYEDDAKAVIFLAADEFVGSKEVSLAEFGDIGFAWAERISTTGNLTEGFVTVVTRESLVFTDSSVYVKFNNPYETVRIIVSHDTPGNGYLHLWGSAVADTLYGGNYGDLLQGNNGDDLLSGKNGNDMLQGGNGDDIIYGGLGNDTVYGGAGDDLINGGRGIDTLYGGAGSDRFVFNPLNNQSTIVDFNTAEDTLDFRHFVPSDGYSLLVVEDQGFKITSNGDTTGAAAFVISVHLEEFYTQIEVRNQADSIVFTAKVTGPALAFNVDDFVSKLTFATSTTVTEVETDFFSNEWASLTYAGIKDIEDKQYYRFYEVTADSEVAVFATNEITVEASDYGFDIVSGTDGNDYISSGLGIDQLFGGAGRDFLDGGTEADIINGGSGSDTLLGRQGNDILHGDRGNDLLFGGTGADMLMGDDGHDMLIGGRGSDLLEGGAGSDVFVFHSEADQGADTIVDYSITEDTLVFDGLKEDELTFSGDSLGTLISWDTGSVMLVGIDLSNAASFEIDYI